MTALWKVVSLGCLMAIGLAAAPPAGRPEPPWGQGQLAFRHYAVDQGLTNLADVSLAQDAEGFLWVGSEDGLFRYDGRTFQKFGMAEGLPSPSVRRVRCTSDGWVWVETDRGLARGRQGRFQGVPLGGKVQGEGLYQALCTDGQGRVWVGAESGLWTASGDGPLKQETGVPVGAIPAVWADASGKTLLAARRGELLMRGPDGQWRRRALPTAYRKETPQGLLLDTQGRLWVRSSTWLLRLASFEADPEDLSPRLPAGPIQTPEVIEDAFRRIWVPTGRGAVCFTEAGDWLLDERAGLSKAGVNALMVDREGSLWVASEGVFRQLGGLAWSYLDRRNGLPHDTVWSVRRTRDGRLWAGTYQGLALAEQGVWREFPGTDRRTYYALAEDEEGTLWVGGLRSRKHGTGSLLRIPKGARQAQEVLIPSIRGSIGSLAAGPDGALWIASVGEGLHRARWEKGALASARVPLPGEADKELLHQVVLTPEGHPIVSGTTALWWFDGSAWHRMGKADGLLDDQPGPIALAPDGTLWVAYWDVHGLSRLRKEGGAWKLAGHVTTPEPLTTDSIYSMTVDAKGVLWMGCAIGVRRFDGQRLVHFTHHEGLPGDDCSGNALFAEANGDVWVGMTSGLARFHAEAFRAPAEGLPTWIIGFKDGAGRAQAPGSQPNLRYQERAVTFTFSPATFLQESRAKAQVRLVGFEDEWRDAEVFQARYTGLPPGTFRFEVRARSPHGDVGVPASQTFVVLPPWWRTWWALILGSLGLGGLVVALIRWRTRMIFRRMVELDALVHERTWNLEDANQALSMANQALEEASMVDPLTGLKNRRFLGLSLPEELARVQRAHHRGGAAVREQDLAFILVDLDHFKGVNDTYGHAAGDAVLRQASAVLRAACREADTIVRWGGEEFLIVGKATDRESVETIARKIREGMDAHVFDLGNGVRIPKSCSIGFSAFPVLPQDPGAFRWEDAVEIADQCLYAAKKSGRDAYVGAWVEASADAASVRDRLPMDLPILVEAGLMRCVSSFPRGHRLTWKEG